MRYYRNVGIDWANTILDLLSGKSRVVRLANKSDRYNGFVNDEIAELERLIAKVKATGAAQAKLNSEALGKAIGAANEAEFRVLESRARALNALRMQAASRIESYQRMIERTQSNLRVELASAEATYDAKSEKILNDIAAGEDAQDRARDAEAALSGQPPSDEVGTES